MCVGMSYTERIISYRKNILQIAQPSQYRCTQLEYRFAVISDAPRIYHIKFNKQVSH